MASIDFGTKQPALTEAVKKILGNYTEGQILKELLQNADDAGASEVKLLVNEKSYPSNRLWKQSLADFQGPALYAWNNACFTDKDWENIGKLYDSKKKWEEGKTGRFGVGFQSVHHITDLPVILSGSRLGILDPHKSFIDHRDGEGSAKTGKLFEVAELEKEYPDHLAPFKKVFDFRESIRTTLFRFPLRCKSSKLSERIPTPAGILGELLSSLQHDAPHLLLFLKKVRSVKLFRLSGSEMAPVEIAEVAVTRSHNVDLMKKESQLQSHFIPCEVTVRFHDRPQNYHWMVCNTVGSTDDDVIKLAEDLHVKPWAGVAFQLPEQVQCAPLHIPLSSAEMLITELIKASCKKIALSPTHKTGKFQGKLFCFLPLSDGSEYQLPVHFHGYFIPKEDRQSIKWPSIEDKSPEAKWNQRLVESVLAPTYYLAMLARTFLVEYPTSGCQKICIPDSFAIWPKHIFQYMGNWSSKLLSCVVQRIVMSNHALFWSPVNKGSWVSPAQALFVDEKGGVIENEKVVSIALKLRIHVVCLPFAVVETISDHQSPRSDFPNVFRSLSPPSLLRALYHVRGSKDYTEGLEVNEKNVLCSYFCSSINVFSPEECLFLKSLPIFSCVPSEHFPALFTSLDKAAGILFPDPSLIFPTPCFSLPSCTCILQVNERNITHLKLLLGREPTTLCMLVERYVIPFNDNQLNNQKKTLYLWVLKHFQESDRNLSCLLSKTAFLPSSVNSDLKWYCPGELFARDESLRYFFIPTDVVHPHVDFQPFEGKLVSLGLQRWQAILSQPDQNLLFDFLVSRVLKVSEKLDLTDDMRNVAANVLQQCRISNLLDRFLAADIPCLLCSVDPPAEFASLRRSWAGQKFRKRFLKPSEICSAKYVEQVNGARDIAGCAVPIVSDICRDLIASHEGVLKKITSDDVLYHLKCVIESCSDIQPSLILRMMSAIYQFFKNDPSPLKNSKLPFFWTRFMFLDPSGVVCAPLEGIASSHFVSVYQVYPKDFPTPNFWKQCGIRDKLTRDNCLQILHSDYKSTDELSEEHVHSVVKLLEYIVSLSDNTTQPSLCYLVPTRTRRLLPLSECVYDDRSLTERYGSQAFSAYNFVHESLSEELVTRLGVPVLSRKVTAPTELTVPYEQTGQHENLTRRIKGILDDYKDNIDIFKELIQNAEDAKASEVKFLFDWRQHPNSKHLLAEGMKDWQGPALVAFNNAVFSDRDFKNINELAGETKMDDPAKIGRFGLGFCTVYHMTDVPMFISRNRFTVFDSHRTNLTGLVNHGPPGVHFDFVENRDGILACYANQMVPFEGLFGCTVQGAEGSGYNGTLFRFPFRTESTSKRSQISDFMLTRDNYHDHLKAFSSTVDTMLAFLRNVRRVELYELQPGCSPDQMTRVMTIEKSWQEPLSVNFKDVDLLNVASPSSKTAESGVFEMTVTYHELNKTESKRWLISSALGRNNTVGKTKGLLPLAEVAVPLSVKDKKTELIPRKGSLFCFLPLSLPLSPLRCHVNGFFDVAKDRRSLRDLQVDGSWNVCLIQDALVKAFVELLTFAAQRVSTAPDSLAKYYSLWPSGGDQYSLAGRLTAAFGRAVVERDPKIVFSPWKGWLPLCEVEVPAGAFKQYYEEPMLSKALEVLNICKRNVVDLPQEVVRGFSESLKTVGLDVFWSCLLKNLGRLPCETVCDQMHFVISNFAAFTRLHGDLRRMLTDSDCIPCKTGNALRLVKPSEAIDGTNKLFSCLYDKSEGRFPIDGLLTGECHAALTSLQMATTLLLDKDVIDRIQRIPKCGSSEQCQLMCDNVLHYLEYHLHRSRDVKRLLERVSALPFLQTSKAPSPALPWHKSSLLFDAPSSLYNPEHLHLVFTFGCTVNQRCPSTVAQQLGNVWKPQPQLEAVVQHLAAVVRWWCEQQGRMEPAAVTFFDKAMPDIYEFLDSSSPHKSKLVELQKLHWIWQNGAFFHPRDLVKSVDREYPPYLQQLSNSNQRFNKLFAHCGLHNSVDESFAVLVLSRIAKDYQRRPIEQRLIGVMNDLLASIRCIPSEPVYLPNEECMLARADQLAYREPGRSVPPIVMGQRLIFVHKDISKHRALNVGVKDLMHRLTDNLVDNSLFGGEDFGQHEDICDRLNGVLKQYEPNVSIFREFVQNAEDAGASEICFVVDERAAHPNQSLFTDYQNWKALQNTPSLLVFNDRPFSDADLKGLAKVGIGSKAGLKEKIGKFGLGFNVAYHVTDTPTFVSFGPGGHPECFCLLDPHKQFLPYGRRLLPGRLWRNGPEMKLENMADQLQPFLGDIIPQFAGKKPSVFHGQGAGWRDGYTVFRLPLTRSGLPIQWSSRITNGCNMTVGLLKELTEKLMKEAEDILIFLNHVRRISVIHISKYGEISERRSTSAAPASLPNELHPAVFGQHVRSAIDELKLNQSPRSFSAVHLLTCSSAGSLIESRKTNWAVSKRFGSPDSREDQCIVQRGFEQSLLPIGGVAVCIGKENFQGKVFVSLPLEDNPSHLPVHVNGHFWVDESRRHLQHTKSGDLQYWNKFIAEKVVAVAYSSLLQSLSSICDSDKLVEWYYTLFPRQHVQKTGSRSVDDFLIPEQLYKYLLHAKAAILHKKWPKKPSNISHPREWLGLEESSDHCRKGYFDHFEHNNLVIDDKLQNALINLGFNFTSAPFHIFTTIAKVCPSYHGRLTTQLLADFLKTLPPIGDIEVVIKPVIPEIWAILLSQIAVLPALHGLPIMLSEDDVLSKVAAPKFIPDALGLVLKMLRHRSCDFISSKICNALGLMHRSANVNRLFKSGIIKHVDLPYVAQHIKIQKGSEPVFLDISDASDQLKLLLGYFWKWLCSIAPDTCVDNLSRHCQQFIFIPTCQSNSSLVVPLCLAKNVLSQASNCGLLGKMNIPVVDFSALHLSNLEVKSARSILTAVGVANVTEPVHVWRILQMWSPNIPIEIETTSEEVQAFIKLICNDDMLKNQHQSIDKQRLRNLPLFHRLGTRPNIRRTIPNSRSCIIPKDIPHHGLLDLQPFVQITFVVNSDSIPASVLDKAEVSSPGALQFYGHVILSKQNFVRMKEDDRNFHIEFLLKDARSKFSEQSWSELMSLLKEFPFVAIKGGWKRVSDLWDPSEEYPKKFISQDDHLPSRWIPFLKDFPKDKLGLRCLPTQEEFLLRCRSICNNSRSNSYLQTHDVLFKTFLRLLNKIACSDITPKDRSFLQGAAPLCFVPPLKLELLLKLKVLPNPPQVISFQGSCICFEDRLDAGALAGFTHAVLPQDARLFKDLKNDHIRSALGVVPLSTSVVFRNLVNICAHFQDKLSLIPVTMIRDLESLFSYHYEYLMVQDRSSMAEKKTLIGNQACWLVAQANFVNLAPLSWIVEKCSQTDTQLYPFLVSIQSNPVLVSCKVLLFELGMKKEPNISHYVSVLRSIQQKYAGSPSNSTLKDQAVLAYHILVKALKGKGETSEEVQYIRRLSPSALVLPVDKGGVGPACQLVLDDSPRIRDWLSQSKYAYMYVTKPPKDFGLTLPECLGVKRLTSIIKEVPTQDISSEMNGCAYERCATERSIDNDVCKLSAMLSMLITSNEFSAGLCRILQNKRGQGVCTEQEKQAVRSVQELRVKCVESISTELQENGQILPRVGRRTQNCMISEGTMFVTFHHDSGQNLLEKCTEQLCRLLSNSVESQHVSALLKSHPDNIETVLDELNLKSYSGDVPVSPGMRMAITKGSSLLFFTKFDKDELVMRCLPDGTFVCARIAAASTGSSLPSVLLHPLPGSPEPNPVHSSLVCKVRRADTELELIRAATTAQINTFGIFSWDISNDPTSTQIIAWLEDTLCVQKIPLSDKQQLLLLERVLFQIHYLCYIQGCRNFQKTLVPIINWLETQHFSTDLLSRVFSAKRAEELESAIIAHQHAFDVYLKMSEFTDPVKGMPEVPWGQLDAMVESSDVVRQAMLACSRPEAEQWKRQAQEDLRAAECLMTGGHFRAACLLGHEAMVKGLKTCLCVQGCLIRKHKHSQDIEILSKEFYACGLVQDSTSMRGYTSIVGKHGACCRQPESWSESEHTPEAAKGVLIATKNFFGLLSGIQQLRFQVPGSPQASPGSSCDFPKCWEQMTTEYLRINVVPTVPEYEEILQLFKKTLPSSRVCAIQRIQNKILWTKYSERKRQMSSDHTYPDANERRLFHGTSDTKPDDICRGTEGFDMRFSQEGLWGEGNYFAVKASYSHDFCHKMQEKKFMQILVAKVLVGCSVKMDQDKTLKMPPYRTGTGQIVGEIRRRYDCIEGSTNGSTIYITYDNAHSYPEYVITYRKPDS